MILAVCGGKGGVGKSTVSLNLARELDAVVVDGDLTTPDLPWGRGPDLHDVLAGRASPIDAVERVGTVDVLPCGRTLAGARAADLERITDVVGPLDRRHSWVVLDCPAGLGADVGYQLFSADAAVLVTAPTRAGLVNALRTRQLARQLETPIVSAVLNKTTGDEVIRDRLERTIGAPTVPVERDADVARAQRTWQPVRDTAPDSPAVDAFETVAETITDAERDLKERRRRGAARSAGRRHRPH
ncbi:MinD/ParA family ATP-binding protein [Halapricum desulfuricans]|uniref:FleN family ATPase involved in flagellar biosynthesis n=1 Tax=Halapricum desulfuricans TaxID=2841257 RepID=A0A897MVX2_9EURY|nr:P-loop NTPase [Halapricum desulfuricans]QSG04421.1 FleN family ATPase involved in flagellar biosynthesis [Halapricum desulfuricans]